MKRACSKCGSVLEWNIENFGRDSSKKNGLTYQCKKCRNRYAQRWREKNRDKVRFQDKFWKMKHPDVIFKSRERWREANPERHRKIIEEWRRNHRDRIRIQARIRRRYHVRHLTDVYILRLIRDTTGRKKEKISKEEIEVKRIELVERRAKQKMKKRNDDKSTIIIPVVDLYG